MSNLLSVDGPSNIPLRLAQRIWTTAMTFLLVIALGFRIITLPPVVELVANSTSYSAAAAMDVYNYSMGYTSELLPLASVVDRAGIDGFTTLQIAHLDDTKSLFSDSLWLYCLILILFHVGVFWCIFTRRRNELYKSLWQGGCIATGLTLLVGLFALASFNGAFSVMHEVLFSQGNWQFDANSLLIQALPTQFWASIAAMWGSVILILSASLFALGQLRLKARRDLVRNQARQPHHDRDPRYAKRK